MLTVLHLITIDVGDRLGITVNGRNLNPNPAAGLGGWDAQTDFFHPHQPMLTLAACP